MSLPIVLFLVFGACFGAATWSRRHLFSEGPTPAGSGQGGAGAWLTWVLVCCALWPIMALTGVHSAWLLSRRRLAAARVRERRRG